jgi:hypothetical protein
VMESSVSFSWSSSKAWFLLFSALSCSLVFSY